MIFGFALLLTIVDVIVIVVVIVVVVIKISALNYTVGNDRGHTRGDGRYLWL